LSRMIDSLLFLARAENPETKVQKAPFDALKEIQSVVDFYEPLSQEEGVELTTSPPGPDAGPVMLHADVILFRRALSNLISNALHHTPRGGRVTISARPTGRRGIEVKVADTGC